MAAKPDLRMAVYAARHHDHNIYDDLRFSGWFDAVAVFCTGEANHPPWVWTKGAKGMYQSPREVKGHGISISGVTPVPPPNGRPVFHFQKLDPRGTLFAPWNECTDDGAAVAALKGRKDCIAFSAGTGYPLADERSIAQGDFGFTAVNAGSIKRATPIPGRDRMDEARELARSARGFLVVSVYGTRVEIERRDYVSSKRKPVGPVWTIDIAKYGDYEYVSRKEASKAPIFDDGAKVAVREGSGGRVMLSFPSAKAVGGLRPYEYEVTARHVITNLEIIDLQKRVYAPDYAAAAAEPGEVHCFFQRDDLVWDNEIVFDVRPLNCFGKKGDAISGSIYLESPGEREIRLRNEAKKGGK